MGDRISSKQHTRERVALVKLLLYWPACGLVAYLAALVAVRLIDLLRG